MWKKVELKAAETERRIREHVRPWLQEARKLEYNRWWVTWDVDKINDYVDQKFDEEEKGGAARAETTRQTKTDAQRSDENMRNMLAELRGLVEKYAKK